MGWSCASSATFLNENNMKNCICTSLWRCFSSAHRLSFDRSLPVCNFTTRWKLVKLFVFQWHFHSHFLCWTLYVLCVKANVLPINRLCICALTTSMYDISVGILGNVGWFSENALDQTAALATHWPQNILKAKLSQDSERKCLIYFLKTCFIFI